MGGRSPLGHSLPFQIGFFSHFHPIIPLNNVYTLFSALSVNTLSNDTIFQTMVPLLREWFLSSASFNFKATLKPHYTRFYS